MKSKLALPFLVAASLLGAMSIASAQTEPAPGAPSASHARDMNANMNAMASMHHHRYHHHWRYTRRQMDKSRPGGRPVSRKAPG